MITPGQLRALIRNDEALLEHYAQWVESLEPGQLAPVKLAERISQTMKRLHARRTVLLNSILPAAPASTAESEQTSPSVTSGGAQPASTL